MTPTLFVNIHVANGLHSMVMMFYFCSQERLIHIHSQVENHLEEDDHLTETHLKDYRLIHLLDFMDG